jgi:hypothetical protein
VITEMKRKWVGNRHGACCLQQSTTTTRQLTV